MPDFGQSTKGLDPPTVVDHVLLPVADLEEGARKLYERFGLRSIAGGRHPKVGTANMIVPLGSQYLELIAIVDPQEAEGSRLGRRLAHALKEGRTFVAWALRTQSIEGVEAKLRTAGWNLPPVIEGSRNRPDGQVLSWRTQDLETGGEASAIPFVIEWRVPDGLHPGEAEASHRGGTTALRRVVIGARDPRRIRLQLEVLLGESDLYEVREAAVDGVAELVLADDNGQLVIG
ncbi:MAG TPA: VOC family protein [Candidatus Limnocylindria bacterium]|nr:VOC family protein [Candidatus Limnocylindria bacterium]